jgi:hypothetical protein
VWSAPLNQWKAIQIFLLQQILPPLQNPSRWELKMYIFYCCWCYEAYIWLPDHSMLCTICVCESLISRLFVFIFKHSLRILHKMKLKAQGKMYQGSQLYYSQTIWPQNQVSRILSPLSIFLLFSQHFFNCTHIGYCHQYFDTYYEGPYPPSDMTIWKLLVFGSNHRPDMIYWNLWRSAGNS